MKSPSIKKTDSRKLSQKKEYYRANADLIKSKQAQYRRQNRIRLRHRAKLDREAKAALREPKQLPAIDVASAAWMAGVFERAGSMYIYKNSTTRITFALTNDSIPNKIHSIMGDGTVKKLVVRYGKKMWSSGTVSNSSQTYQYLYNIYGIDRCGRFFTAIMPYLTHVAKKRSLSSCAALILD